VERKIGGVQLFALNPTTEWRGSYYEIPEIRTRNVHGGIAKLRRRRRRIAGKKRAQVRSVVTVVSAKTTEPPRRKSLLTGGWLNARVSAVPKRV